MIEILIPFVAFWFAKISGIPQSINLLNRKPFNCSKCMGFWLALNHQFYIGFTYDSIWIVALSSLMAWVIEIVVIKMNIKTN